MSEQIVSHDRFGPWAAICALLALCLVSASMLIDLERGTAALKKAGDQQTAALEVAQRAERQLTALADGTQKLAGEGNENAKTVIALLRQNGIQVAPKPAS